MNSFSKKSKATKSFLEFSGMTRATAPFSSATRHPRKSASPTSSNLNKDKTMVGTKAGGIKAAATNRKRYGSDFYTRIGKKGGVNGHTGGFAANPALAREAGRKGGLISKRGPAKNKVKATARETA